MKIRTKVTLLAAISVAMALAITAAAAIMSIAQSTRALILQSADRGVAQAETSLAIFWTSQIQLLHSLASDPDLWRDEERWNSYLDTVGDTKIDPANYGPAERLIANRFQTLKDSVDSVLQIEVGTDFGTYIMAPPGTKPEQYDPRKRPWYIAAAPGKAANTGARATSAGDLAISFAQPFSSPTGKGVVTLAVSLNKLTSISAQLKIGKDGFVMLFQRDGTILTSVKDPSLVGKNVVADDLKVFATLDIAKDGQTSLKWLGQDWDVLVRASASTGLVFVALLNPREYQDEIQVFLVLMVILSLIVLAMAVVVAALISGSLSRPLVRVTAQLQQIAEGDLHQQLTKKLLTSGGEIGQLSRSLQTMVAALENKAEILEKIAQGDLTVEITLASQKDRLGISLQLMAQSLNDVVSQINGAVQQMTSGAQQVAIASQSSAEGASEQASNLEEIAASATEVTSQARKNMETAQSSSLLARESRKKADDGNLQMKTLMDLLIRMTRSSEETTSIIKTMPAKSPIWVLSSRTRFCPKRCRYAVRSTASVRLMTKNAQRRVPPGGRRIDSYATAARWSSFCSESTVPCGMISLACS